MASFRMSRMTRRAFRASTPVCWAGVTAFSLRSVCIFSLLSSSPCHTVASSKLDGHEVGVNGAAAMLLHALLPVRDPQPRRGGYQPRNEHVMGRRRDKLSGKLEPICILPPPEVGPVEIEPLRHGRGCQLLLAPDHLQNGSLLDRN